MPELPEVEEAAARLRAAIEGRTIARVVPLHRTLEARLPRRVLAALKGAVVQRVERRGKHQLIHLADGRTIHVHFRMSGDWTLLDTGDAMPRTGRLAIELEGGRRIVLDDPRALGTVDVHPADAPPVLDLGPEATDPSIDPAQVHALLARRRGAIKPALLDQRMLAGVGNIYAAEACWYARLDPRRAASSLSVAEVKRLLAAVRKALDRATGARYRSEADRFEVYGRRGEPCRRCRTPIAQVTQAGRSTYFCPRCQAPERRVSRAPRAGRP